MNEFADEVNNIIDSKRTAAAILAQAKVQAAKECTRILAEAASYLTSRLKPQSYTLSDGRRQRIRIPQGYTLDPIGAQEPYSELTLLTSDGRLWQSKGSKTKGGRFIDINARAFSERGNQLTTDIMLTRYYRLAVDWSAIRGTINEPYLWYSNMDDYESTPLATWLAQRIAAIIESEH